MSKILVKKKQGYLEDFDIDKIKSALIKAGSGKEEATRIARKIREWAKRQPGRVVNSFEIEKQIIGHTKEKNKDVLISFLFFAKSKIKPIERVFGKRDIAQMLTSLFVIIQIYVLEKIDIPFIQGIPVLMASFGTCFIILWLIEGQELWKHLLSGLVLVSLLSMLVGVMLDVAPADMIIAISVGLPVAAMVDVIGSRD